ncbi:hypothetical protein O9993_19115 [Vibrio lentus]|nr:hypothetical protein [Vibrio lentus]
MFSLLSLMQGGEEYKRLAKQIVRRRYNTFDAEKPKQRQPLLKAIKQVRFIM